MVLRKVRKAIPVQKPSGQTTFTNYLLLTRKPAWIRAGRRRNVRISKENKSIMFYCLTTLVLTGKFWTISSTEKVASKHISNIYGTAAFTQSWKILLFPLVLTITWLHLDWYISNLLNLALHEQIVQSCKPTAPCQSKKENLQDSSFCYFLHSSETI